MVSCNAPRSSLAVYSAGIGYSCIWSAGAGLHPWHCSSLLDAELGHPRSLCAGGEERRELPPEGEPLKRSDLPSGGWSLSFSLQGLCREPRQAGRLSSARSWKRCSVHAHLSLLHGDLWRSWQPQGKGMFFQFLPPGIKPR